MLRTLLAVGTAVALCLALSSAVAQTVRIKDLATVGGVRSNQLVGYGLVVGLNGTGDSQQVRFSSQSIANMLQRFGVTVSPSGLRAKNVAAVMVTADLPPFARAGSRIDVTVSSLGDATSLQGGTLLQTPLMGADGQVYAVAQGAVSVGGFTAGGTGTAVTKNHVTAGRIPAGAIVEREVPMPIGKSGAILLTLGASDFVTASRVASAVNAKLPGSASAVDAATVRVDVPPNRASDLVGLIAELEELAVEPDAAARVVVNERTGTVVVGGAVRISAAAVTHGDLHVEIGVDTIVAQPPALSGGSTAVVTQPTVSAKEEARAMVAIKATASVDDLVKALNALKVTPRDVIAILQALKQAGALHAALEVF
ncbi:MAG: flagellar basal body P-ring protein FlgI [Armatimonadota bacterium]